MKPLLGCLDIAYKKTQNLLLPFQKKVWIKLFFLYLLAGSCTSFPGFGLPSDNNKDKKEPAKIEVSDQTNTQTETPAPTELEKLPENFKPPIGNWGETFKKDRKWLVPLVIGLGLIFVVILVFWFWVSSRIYLTLLSCLDTNNISIRENWHKTRDQGQSFFKFNVAIFFIPIIFLVFVGWAVDLSTLKALSSIGAMGLILGTLSFFVFLILIFTIYLLIHSFLPVVMYKKNLMSGEAAKLIVQFIRESFVRSMKITLFYVVFSIAILTLFGIVGIILALLVFLPYGLIFGGTMYVMAKWALTGKLLAGALLGLLGFIIGFVFLLVYIVPLQTFLTYLRLALVENETKAEVSQA